MKKLLMYIGLAILMAFTLAPFLSTLTTSFSTNQDIISGANRFFPRHITFANFEKAIMGQSALSGFVSSMFNSLTVAAVTTFFCLLFGALGAYAFARLNFRFRDSFMLLVLITQMIPGIAILIPIYVIFRQMGFLDTKTSIMLAQMAFNLPFIIWIMRSFFYSIPKDLEEAAFIDGLGRFGALFRIIMPISTPGLFATGVFAFMNSWNDFLTPLVLTSSQHAKTMPVAINEFLGRFTVDYGLLAAAGFIGIIPPILIILFFQRYLIEGLTAGAVK
ncbi:carbohydrate ABC transporter permease [Cohnella silvisoli]|uniref:Carbohydrate ABC transporter permease n=1 Tax=Cohnella silvisoli TaxID=2873699 RepID=A0ABV1KTL6_9BACL|nr:carbohydrate ABC transporter permease [Cohnella silvisoli]MCD9022856.1 carbohydrate ABC transporter permease [Cohnella silvisoli]